MKIMKNIILAFAIGFFVQDVYSSETLLSKFHQNGYKLKDVRIQLLNYDKDLFNLLELKAFKYNRTTTAHNCTVNIKKTVKDQVEVLVQGYNFRSNEYRYFPVRFQINLKKGVDADIIGLGQTKKCGNLTSYYFYKDVTYHFCNFVVDETRFPPLIPDGRYKVDLTLLYLNKEIAWLVMYCEVYTPIPYPKN